MNRRNVLIALALLMPGAQQATAQTYPNKPIRLIVPFAAGGVTDVVARITAQGMQTQLGQPIVVDNRPGASGIPGSEAAARAAPDGYTLLMGNISTLSINPAMFIKLPYDPTKSFTPISMVSIQPLLVAVNNDVAAKTLPELVKLAKAKPGTLSFGSAGSSLHLATEAFNQAAGLEMVHIPYKGSAPAITDLIGGHIQVLFDPFSSLYPQAREGKVRGLAVTSKSRWSAAPELPTLSELGFPSVEVTSWQGIVAPTGTPAAVIARLQEAIHKALADPAIKAQLAKQGTEASPSSPEQFAKYIQEETARWKEVARKAGVKPE